MHMSHQSAPPRIWPFLLATVIALGLAAFVLYRSQDTPIDPEAAGATTTVTRLSPACADALALADKLIGPGSRLASAARAHAAVMELLEDGDITGHQAYVRGQAQVTSMLHDSPDVAVFVKRYQEVRKGCPLK